MRLNLFVPAVALAACLTAVPAHAAITVYYHAGAWDAFDGQAATGEPLCGLGSRNPADGRSLSLSFQIGGNDLTFIADKPGWTIPQGTQIPVVMQIGLNRPWIEQATGSGENVTWTMGRADVQTFDSQFRSAGSMTVTFPSGDEHPWIISLSGSTAVSNAMSRCVSDLTRRANAAQASAPPAAQGDNSGTQPFGAASAAAGQAAPAQAAPGQAAPGTAAPGQAASGQAAPGQAAPQQAATQAPDNQPAAAPPTSPAPSH